MRVALVLVTSEGRQTEVELKKPVQVIGRQTDCALRLPTAGVSRHHTEVSVADGKVNVRDMGSSNGTFVNRRRVTQIEVAPGDLMCVGEHVFVIRVDGKPERIDADDAYDEGLVLPASSVAAAKTAGQALAQPAQPKTEEYKRATPVPEQMSRPAGKPTTTTAPAAPAKKPIISDDDEDNLLGKADPDGSSVGDFDFLDEDDDLKTQPKL